MLIVRIAEGLIVEDWLHGDKLELPQHLGLLPSSAGRNGAEHTDLAWPRTWSADHGDRSAIVLAVAGPGRVAGQEQKQLKQLQVNGVALHYLDRGHGAAVVFIHGALVDYRRWAAQFDPFAQHYRMIAYSRRYNFPNQNPDLRPDHSARVEAEDLAAFITALQLGPVHVIGESIGASIGLLLAVRHPDLVRTLVLAEPPELRWVNDVPGGPAVFNEFMHNVWEPVGQAFRAGDAERALRLSVDVYFAPGLWDELPADVKDSLWANQREWEALTTSNDSFPVLSRADVEQLTVPTLMLTGEKTLPIHQLVNDELERLVPNGVRVRFPDATHELWDEFPEQARDTTLTFLANQ